MNPAMPASFQTMDAVGVAGMRAGFSSDLIHVLLAASDPAVQIAARGRSTIDERPAEAVELRGADGQTRKLYFDAQNRRLVALDQHEGGSGGFSTRRFYSDYRNVQGLQWPHSEIRYLNDQRVMEIRVTRVLLDSGVEDSVFEKPEPELARPSR
jgi:hypothetical protein